MKISLIQLDEFYAEFQTPKVYLKGMKKAIGMSLYNLVDLIGYSNANRCVVRALNSKEDQVTVKLRKYGTIYIYRK